MSTIEDLSDAYTYRAGKMLGDARKKRWDAWREEAFKEQGGKCCYCAEPMKLAFKHYGEDDFATRDHIVPRSRYGANNEANSALCCYRCNQEKGDRTPEEWLSDLEWPDEAAA